MAFKSCVWCGFRRRAWVRDCATKHGGRIDERSNWMAKTLAHCAGCCRCLSKRVSLSMPGSSAKRFWPNTESR